MLDTATYDKPFTLDATRYTAAPFQLQVVFRLDAPRDTVWALMSDHSKIPSYFPGVTDVTVDNSKAEEENGVGCVRSCSVNGMPLTEDIVVFEAERALGYKIRDPNPMGMTNHFGVFLLESDGRGGTLVTWKQYFEHPEAEAFTTQIRPLMSGMVQNLISRFGGESVDA